MDYCKIKNKPIFYYEAEKKRQKIDFRGFSFFFCHHFRYCDIFDYICFFLFLFGKITSDQNGKQTHPDDTFHFFCVFLCAILLLGFLDCRNSFHLDFVKVR